MPDETAISICVLASGSRGNAIHLSDGNTRILVDAGLIAKAAGNLRAQNMVAVGAAPEPPKLFVTKDGQTIRELTFDQPRLLIGRSEHNDIAIPSRFVSRHHLLLVRHGNTTFMMDLNSSNGTFVNSRRVSNQVLADNDIITVGNHRIKFCDPHAKGSGTMADSEVADTAIMKTLDDMRNLLTRENTAMLPLPTENLPTYGEKTN